ncbi:MAG: hypothetical protein H6727_09045 [Myxococcales bacterium]|nr:hypothetical protein [Myxococcales bacterium]
MQNIMNMFWFFRDKPAAKKPGPVPKEIRTRLVIPFVDPAIPAKSADRPKKRRGALTPAATSRPVSSASPKR